MPNDVRERHPETPVLPFIRYVTDCVKTQKRVTLSVVEGC